MQLANSPKSQAPIARSWARNGEIVAEILNTFRRRIVVGQTCHLSLASKAMTETYRQPSNEAARRAALSHAVGILSIDRHQATCVRETYVREVRDHLASRGTSYDKDVASCLSDHRVLLWEEFFRSRVGQRAMKDLTVCYLAGPEPLNDFRVLVDLGIHPHNIWAFESDQTSYAEAIEAVRGSGFPMLKVHRGSIEHFFESSPQRFDIIYLDACGPLPSPSQKTLKMVSTLLRHHRLASPGALITNFACPDMASPQQVERYTRLVAAYLYPKGFLEFVHKNGEPGATEGPICEGLLLDERDWTSDQAGESQPPRQFLDLVRADFPSYYGQYITRQLMDLASVIAPWIRLLGSTYGPRLFTADFAKIAEQACQMNAFDQRTGDGGEVVADADHYPLQWAVRSLLGGLENRPAPPGIADFVQSWLDQMGGGPASRGGALQAIECYDVLRRDHRFYSENLKRAIQCHRHGMHQFCDVPTETLMFDLLINQLVFPMHYVTPAIRRWSYTAKQTTMFLDVMVLDGCRYLYDWMPTLDLADEGLSDIQQQLSYRFALDGLAKNRRWYNTEYFFGAAVIGQDTRPFDARYLAQRRSL